MQKIAMILIVFIIAESIYLGSTVNAGRNIRYYDISPATGKSSGSFGIFYSAPENKSLLSVYQDIKQTNLFDGIVRQLNDNFVIPTDIWIIFSQCGSPTAFYDPSQKKIEICYEFINNMENLYAATNTTNASSAAINNAEFVLYHEIGHALIDTLNIPVTGREEDASDQLATLLILGNGQENNAPIDVTAYSFAVQGAFYNPSDMKFWDVHSLDSQRFFNILCWSYGENPAKYQTIVSQLLPQERADRCGSEYAKMFDSWARLLKPYFKG
jgi:hypothetical protein